MEKEKWYHILKDFVWQHRWQGTLFAAFAGIFAMIFSLYDLETEAVLYATVLSLLLGAVAMGVAFFFYWIRVSKGQRPLI